MVRWLCFADFASRNCVGFVSQILDRTIEQQASQRLAAGSGPVRGELASIVGPKNEPIGRNSYGIITLSRVFDWLCSRDSHCLLSGGASRLRLSGRISLDIVPSLSLQSTRPADCS